MIFFTGVHKPQFAGRLQRAMLSANVLEHRKSGFPSHDWILDSGAFTRISSGRGHLSVEDYAAIVTRWKGTGNLVAAVAQDWMCEPFILDITGLTIEEHQRRSTESWLRLRALCPDVYIMPVIQGWGPQDYAAHVRAMSDDLEDGAWVGVGSVCKRQSNPAAISSVLSAILAERPDLRLHGFGVKATSLKHLDIVGRLYSADSMAWSFAGRRMEPSRANDPELAVEWTAALESAPIVASQIAMGV